MCVMFFVSPTRQRERVGERAWSITEYTEALLTSRHGTVMHGKHRSTPIDTKEHGTQTTTSTRHIHMDDSRHYTCATYTVKRKKNLHNYLQASRELYGAFQLGGKPLVETPSALAYLVHDHPNHSCLGRDRARTKDKKQNNDKEK